MAMPRLLLVLLLRGSLGEIFTLPALPYEPLGNISMSLLRAGFPKAQGTCQVNIPIPTKIKPKMHLPQNGTIGFDPQPNIMRLWLFWKRNELTGMRGIPCANQAHTHTHIPQEPSDAKTEADVQFDSTLQITNSCFNLAVQRRYDALEPHIDAQTMKIHHGRLGLNDDPAV